MNQLKYTICIFICCWFVQGVSAQVTQYNLNRNLSDKILDSAHLQITYSLSYIQDSIEPNKVWKDRKILLIGDTIQHFFSEYQRSKDSAATTARAKEKAFKPLSFSGNIIPEGYDIYIYPMQGVRMVQEHITELTSY